MGKQGYIGDYDPESTFLNPERTKRPLKMTAKRFRWFIQIFLCNLQDLRIRRAGPQTLI